MRKSRIASAFALSSLAWTFPLHAALPEAARQMIDAARASGDDAKVATVLGLARSTWPGDDDEIARIETEWQAELLARKQAAIHAKEETIRSAGLLELWKGEIELGGFQASGNSESVGATASAKIRRDGVDWSHQLQLRFDYQRQNSVTSREQYFASYEPRWQFNKSLFTYGLAQFERDQLQGVDARYAASGGIGYKVVDSDPFKFSIKAGPAYRVTEYTDGRTDNRFAALAGIDLDWKILDRLTLTQNANATAETGGVATVLVDGSNTSVNLVTGLDLAVSNRLRARMSYQLDYDSNPPAGKFSTDTLTRASLVYGF
jgi:putative salt-induced outer membrane protein